MKQKSPQDRKENDKNKERKKPFSSAYFIILLETPSIFSGSSVVKIIPPNPIDLSSYVIAIWVIGQNPKIGRWNQIVVPIDNL